MEINIEQLTKEAFNKLVRDAAKEIIVTKLGYGLQSEMKTAIESEAARLLREDDEIKQILKDRIKYWIKQQ